MFHDPVSHFKSQHMFLFFQVYLRNLSFWFISQNSNVLFTSRLQWLIRLKGKSLKKKFDIIMSTEYMSYISIWIGGLPGCSPPTPHPQKGQGSHWAGDKKSERNAPPGSTERVLTSAGQQFYFEMALRDLTIS